MNGKLDEVKQALLSLDQQGSDANHPIIHAVKAVVGHLKSMPGAMAHSFATGWSHGHENALNGPGNWAHDPDQLPAGVQHGALYRHGMMLGDTLHTMAGSTRTPPARKSMQERLGDMDNPPPGYGAGAKK